MVSSFERSGIPDEPHLPEMLLAHELLRGLHQCGNSFLRHQPTNKRETDLLLSILSPGRSRPRTIWIFNSIVDHNRPRQRMALDNVMSNADIPACPARKEMPGKHQ